MDRWPRQTGSLVVGATTATAAAAVAWAAAGRAWAGTLCRGTAWTAAVAAAYFAIDTCGRSLAMNRSSAAIAASGLPVERYYHWCFCDNFEWLEGESARFGLINVDYATQTRTIKRSGEFYADMLHSGGVTDEAYDAYIRGEVYHIE